MRQSIERIPAAAAHDNVVRVPAHRLQRLDEIDRHFRLVRADEYQHFERMPVQQRHILRLNVFVVDQDVVRSHPANPPWRDRRCRVGV